MALFICKKMLAVHGRHFLQTAGRSLHGIAIDNMVPVST
jgi:hypothetical protein